MKKSIFLLALLLLSLSSFSKADEVLRSYRYKSIHGNNCGISGYYTGISKVTELAITNENLLKITFKVEYGECHYMGEDQNGDTIKKTIQKPFVHDFQVYQKCYLPLAKIFFSENGSCKAIVDDVNPEVKLENMNSTAIGVVYYDLDVIMKDINKNDITTYPFSFIPTGNSERLDMNFTLEIFVDEDDMLNAKFE